MMLFTTNDDDFVSCLDNICRELKMAEDDTRPDKHIPKMILLRNHRHFSFLFLFLFRFLIRFLLKNLFTFSDIAGVFLLSWRSLVGNPVLSQFSGDILSWKHLGWY